MNTPHEEDGTVVLTTMIVIGTRPEAIKMAPLVEALKAHADVDVKLCSTGQHRHMLDQVLRLFNLEPDFDLDIMRVGQDLTDITTAVLKGLREVFREYKPDRLFVHGDTTTSFAASMAAFYAGVPVSHVEAGLRTGNIHSPWPEEANRRLSSVIADRHYAPTEQSKKNLLAENIPTERIQVTGNTVIDALKIIAEQFNQNTELQEQLKSTFSMLDSDKRMLLVTGHRRENFGDGFERICTALAKISERDDVQVVYPVHLNPNVQEPVNRLLGDYDNVYLLEPLEYLPFTYLMTLSDIIITDSGGIQEEAPALSKPVLVLRDTTERPEAVEAGTVKLIGTETDVIVSAVNELLDDKASYDAMSIAANPYGTGDACKKIVADVVMRSGGPGN